MMLGSLPQEGDLLATLVAWGTAEPSIRAMILTSTRAVPGGRADLLSDYDIVLAVADAERFWRDDAWVSIHGTPMVRFSDRGECWGWSPTFTVWFTRVG